MSRRVKAPEEEEQGYFKVLSDEYSVTTRPTGRPSSAGKSSIIGASFNLINSIIGAGLVGLPAAVADCGLVVGTAMLIALALMIEKSLILMIESGIKEKKRNLEELCLVLFGPIGYYVSALFMFSYSYGSMVACMIVVGDTVPICVHHLLGISLNRDVAMAICAVVIILPLCLFRSLSSLSSTSFLSFCGVVILVVLVCVRGPAEGASQGISFDIHKDISVVTPHVFIGVGTISFHYVCQQTAFLVFGSMEDETIAGWKSVTKISMAFGFVLSIAVGLWGYLCFLEDVEGNILNNFNEYDGVVSVARLGMGVNVIFTFPVECFVVRHALLSVLLRLFHSSPSTDRTEENSPESFIDASSHSTAPFTLDTSVIDAIQSPCKGGRSVITPAAEEEPLWSTTTHIAVTVYLWSSAVGLSMMVKDLSTVIEFSGVVAGSMLAFILPSVVYLKSHQAELLSLIGINSPKNSSGVPDKYPGDQTEGFECPPLADDHLSARRVHWRLAQAVGLCVFGVFALCSGLFSMAVRELNAQDVEKNEEESVHVIAPGMRMLLVSDDVEIRYKALCLE